MIRAGLGLLVLGCIPVALYWRWRNDTRWGSWLARYNVRAGLVLATLGLVVLLVGLVVLAVESV